MVYLQFLVDVLGRARQRLTPEEERPDLGQELEGPERTGNTVEEDHGKANEALVRGSQSSECHQAEEDAKYEAVEGHSNVCEQGWAEERFSLCEEVVDVAASRDEFVTEIRMNIVGICNNTLICIKYIMLVLIIFKVHSSKALVCIHRKITALCHLTA